MRKILFIATVLYVLMPAHVGAQSRNAVKTKVACVGNSITFGASLSNTAKDSYPAVLGQMLGKDYDVRNFGCSGSTLLYDGNQPYVNMKVYKEALAFSPDIVLIMLGTNDSKPQNWNKARNFERDLQSLVDSFMSLDSTPEILLCYPPKCYADKHESIRDSVILYGVIPHVLAVAERNGLRTVDMHSATSGVEEMFPDKVHPGVEGSILIARTAYKAITGKDIEFSSQPFPGVKSRWRGYDKYDFKFNGRDAIVVAPSSPLPGKPWIWRPAFFGAFPAVDLAMLSLGYHVVYYDVTFLYGSPNSLNLGDKFFGAMLKYYGLSDKVIVEGFSRGGLFAVNWAARNPDRVSCLYLDAPVCDITSWPGRERKGLWDEFLKEWNLTERDMESFNQNPLDNLKPLAKAGIPIIGVAGDSDKTVPYEDNLAKLAARYKKLGGNIEIILKPGCDHHPHSLDAPAPIVRYLLDKTCK